MEPITIESPESKSADIAAENVERLKELFPAAFVDGELDINVLRQLVGGVPEAATERFGLNWHGKSMARDFGLTPSRGTLRPNEGESLGWAHTRNLMIEGDNLEVLKILQKAYANRVKLIYIDPPYNTGKEFIYPDRYSDNLDTYLRYSGQLDDEDKRTSSAEEVGGRFHTRWLNMMYPRLMAAHRLLSDDGVCFISIDDAEVSRLRAVCDEIFGEENWLASLIWNKQHSQQQGLFKKYHEYVLVYAKRADRHSNITGGEGIIEAQALKKVSKANPASPFTFPPGVRFEAPDGTRLVGEFGDGERVVVDSGALEARDGMTTEEVTLSAGWTQKTQMASWFRGEEVFDTKGQRVLEFYFSSTGKLKCRKERSKITPSTILPQYGMVSEQTAHVQGLFGAPVFERPKPVAMMRDFIDWFADDGDIVMDFFAGSASFCEGALLARPRTQFVAVQLPEPIDPESDAGRAAASQGLKTISALSRERVRRVIQRIEAQPDSDASGADLGFRVFVLDSSNVRAWDPTSDDLAGTLISSANNIKEDRTELDLLFEIMLKLGIPLTAPFEVRAFAGAQVYNVGSGALIVCIPVEISRVQVDRIAEGITSWVRDDDPAGDTRIVFRDGAFTDDVAKSNMTAILEQQGFDRANIRSI